MKAIFKQVTAMVLSGGATIALLGSPTSLQAQFRIQSSDNLEVEDTNLPANLLHGHNSNPFTTKIISYTEPSIAEMLGDLYRPDVLGQKGISFTPLPEEPHLSLVTERYLDRSKLTGGMVALIEGDFFIPAGGEHPTLGVLASKHDPNYGKQRGGYQFYRFGLQPDRVYFSFTNSTPSPVFYHRQELSDFDIKRPGWIRLQMAFHADGNIFCYIDGKQTSFSPINDTTLVQLSPGMMVTRYKESEGSILADNLSLLWSPTKDKPTQSPWTEGEVSSYAGAIQWNRGGITWHTNFSDAWHDARTHNKHILVFLHDANEEANEYSMKLLETPEAQGFMKFVIPLRTNIATEYGMQISQNMGVKTSPAFVILKPEGTPFSLAEVSVGQSQWPDIQKLLTKPKI